MNIGRFQNVQVREYDRENFTAVFDFGAGLTPDILTPALEDMRKQYAAICTEINKPADAKPLPETVAANITATLNFANGTAAVDITLDIEADFSDGWSEFTAIRNIFTDEEFAVFAGISLEMYRAHFASIFKGLAQSIRKAAEVA